MSNLSDLENMLPLEIDLNEIPLVALSGKTRQIICLGLDCLKIIPSPGGSPRDWRGLADYAKVGVTPCTKPDSTANVLCLWSKTNAKFQDLIEALKYIDRWDVLDDISPSILSDIKNYSSNDPNEPNDLQSLDKDFTLTDDDVRRKHMGLGPQKYDAFLLFAEEDKEDKEFAREITNKLENDYNAKLCLKDRDLLGGISIENEAMMVLISQRCFRVITVLSASFFNSSANKFLVAFAQALAIRQGSRKIIPVTYKNIKLDFPVQLQHYFILNYDRANNFGNFWDKLNQSIKPPLQSTRQIKPVLKAIEHKETELVELKDWDCKKKDSEVLKDENEVFLSKSEEISALSQSEPNIVLNSEASTEKIKPTNPFYSQVKNEGTDNKPDKAKNPRSSLIKKTKNWFKTKKRVQIAVQF